MPLKRVPKQQKAAWRFKENKRKATALRPYIYIPYAERTDKASNAEVNKRHKLKVRTGKTSKDRATHAVYKRDALRGYNKKHGNMKVCTGCDTSKAVSDFDYQKDSKHPKKQRRAYCFVCRKRANAEAYQKRKAEGYYDDK